MGGFNTEHPFVLEPVSASDLRVATIAFGWTMGFGFFTVLNAWRQTHRLNVFAVLIWGEILVCLIFAIICILYLEGVIQHSFAFYFSILTTWALQVQFLLQIIINRICILWVNPKHKAWLKGGVAALITIINITVYCIWVPARLQISDRYVRINEYWDRTEKIIYLVVDGLLNWLFIRTVKNRLVSYGLTKYDALVRFNTRIVFISLMGDVLIISMMSYPNSFVYMQFHPVAYIMKLNIELSMSSLIVSLSQSTGGSSSGIVTKSGSLPLRVDVVTNVAVEQEVDTARSEFYHGAGIDHSPQPMDRHERTASKRVRPHSGARAYVRPNPFSAATPVILGRNPFSRKDKDDDMLKADKEKGLDDDTDSGTEAPSPRHPVTRVVSPDEEVELEKFNVDGGGI